MIQARRIRRHCSSTNSSALRPTLQCRATTPTPPHLFRRCRSLHCRPTVVNTSHRRPSIIGDATASSTTAPFPTPTVCHYARPRALCRPLFTSASPPHRRFKAAANHHQRSAAARHLSLREPHSPWTTTCYPPSPPHAHRPISSPSLAPLTPSPLANPQPTIIPSLITSSRCPQFPPHLPRPPSAAAVLPLSPPQPRSPSCTSQKKSSPAFSPSCHPHQPWRACGASRACGPV